MPAPLPDPPRLTGGVLILDDDPIIRSVLRKILASRGLSVFEAANLTLARMVLDRLPIDLVLLDIHLPDGNGFDLLPEIVARRRGVRVAVISGDETASQDPSFQSETSLIGFISKPFTHDRIDRMLDSVFAPR